MAFCQKLWNQKGFDYLRRASHLDRIYVSIKFALYLLFCLWRCFGLYRYTSPSSCYYQLNKYEEQVSP